jgi:hypothetical protein
VTVRVSRSGPQLVWPFEFVEKLKRGGGRFRNEIVGNAGKQILIEDPYPIELFEPFPRDRRAER